MTSPTTAPPERTESTGLSGAETGLASPQLNRWKRFTRAQNIVIGVAIAIICYLVIGPLVYLAWGTFFDRDGFTLGAFGRAFGDSETTTMVINSLIYSVGSTAVAMIIGTVLAYLVARTDVPFKGLTFVGALMPAFLPAVLYAPAWIFIGASKGGLANWALPFDLPAWMDIYSLWGMIWVEGLHLSSIAFLLMMTAFRAMDPALEESARVNGSRGFAILRKITLPLSRPALTSSALIIFILALESFDVPVMIGVPSGVYVFTTRIYFLLGQYPVDLGAAGAMSIGLLVIAALVSLGFSSGDRGRRAYQTVTGKGYRPQLIKLGKARMISGALVFAYFLVAVAAPILVLLYASLLPFYQLPSAEAWSRLSFENYSEIASDSTLAEPLLNTIMLGLGSAVVVMSLTAIGSWFVTRSRSRLRRVVSVAGFVPLVIPGLVLGLAVAFVYLRSPVPLYGTLWILLIAYTTRFLPYGMRYGGAAMSQLGSDLEESARVSGASWWYSFRRVVLPLAGPGLLAGGIYVLIVSFRELGASILLVSPDTPVVSILIFNQFSEGAFTLLAATGMVIMFVLLILVYIGYRIGSKIGIQMG